MESDYDYDLYKKRLEILYEKRTDILKEELRKNNNKVVETLLDSTDGFFYGPTDINEYYFDNLGEIINFVSVCRDYLKDLKPDEFLCYSCWY